MQKKNREGFTLIELLAVIVILAIIALIAVPVIMNVITKARISAFEDSAYGIVKAGEMYYTNKLLEAEGMTGDKEFIISNGSFEGDALDVSGSLPSSGKVTVTSEGKVALVISNGEYCIQKATTESSVKALKQESCSDYKKIANPVFTTSDENASIPACITNNTACAAGTPVAVKVNASETYDFYVMSEEGNNITLIMNKNLGGTVAWASEEDYGCGVTGDNCSQNDKGPITALKALEERTSSWTNISNSLYNSDGITRTARARLITHSEAIGLGCEDYFTNTCPDWLYRNTYSDGDDTNIGYWTSSVYASYSLYTWGVNYGGTDYSNVYYDGGIGVRPVITISKTVI